MRKEDYIRKQLQKGIKATDLDIGPYIPSTYRGGSWYESRPFATLSEDGKYAYNGVEILKNRQVIKRIILKKSIKGIINLNNDALNLLTCHCKISKIKDVDFYYEMLVKRHIFYEWYLNEYGKYMKGDK